jgi:Rrf2 family protein
MKISAKGEYGLLALIDLALYQKEGPVQLAQISQRQAIPKQYLDQLMLILKRARIVTSSRGRQGGYQLAKPAHAITLLEVVTALEGPVENQQFLGRSPAATRAARRVLNQVWDEMFSQAKELLRSKTLEQICEQQRNSEKLMMYHI